MSKRHAFDQLVVLETPTIKFSHHDSWITFVKWCEYFGFKIKLTGGAFLTHEINGTMEDFETILELMISNPINN